VIGTVSGAGSSFVDGGLIDGGRAFYRVQAVYTGGADSAVSNQVRTRRPFLPNPAGLSLQSITADSATLAWSDAAESESRYVVERRRDYPDGSFGPVRDAATGAPDTETATDTGVVPERLHEFQVRAERDETVLRIDDSDATGVATASTPVAVEFGDGASLRFELGDGQPIGRVEREVPNSGIKEIGWTGGGSEESGFSQLGFAGGGEEVETVTEIGFGGN